MSDNHPLDFLRIADPETHVWVAGRVALMRPAPSRRFLTRLAETTVWALSLESGLGRVVTEGLLQLGGQAHDDLLDDYVARVRRAGATGPTLARLMAMHLVPVLAAGPAMVQRFDTTVGIMRGKGTYTLFEPLSVLGTLLKAEEVEAAGAYLDLLATTFGQDISYNRSVRLVYLLPKAVRDFVPRRRKAQIEQLRSVIQTDPRLVDPFLEGMEKGAALLGATDLARFVDAGLSHHGRSPKAGIAFLSLSSEEGRHFCARLQKVVPLSRIRASLERYLAARLGHRLPVRPMSALGDRLPEGAPMVCSDGHAIYLPDEIDQGRDPAANIALAKLLIRLEAGFFEWDSFAFDLARAIDRYPAVARRAAAVEIRSVDGRCDAERFLDCFQRPALAEAIWLLWELGRVVTGFARRYPGLLRAARPALQNEADRLWPAARADWWTALYRRLILGGAPTGGVGEEWVADLERCFLERMAAESPVEAGADLVCHVYDALAERIGKQRGRDRIPKRLPLGWRLYWPLVGRAFAPRAEAAERLRRRLAEQGIRVYRADLQQMLVRQRGELSSEELQRLVLTRGQGPVPSGADGAHADLAALLAAAGLQPAAADAADGSAFRYPEWDHQLQDYLRDHVRVQPAKVTGSTDDDVYQSTLQRHRGVVTRMRRAFELLKPEGLTLLRQWPEGDAFDHRALIDFVIDRRAGRIPSDRLFIKRLKQERDVAVLLLVDLSRSTANPVAGGQATVLEVAKEALVLFCEALQVVGDSYAIAGFSGTGRHSVDYFTIKAFGEALTPAVKAGISGLRPHRSTRMGAAIRHATVQLAPLSSRVRLLILVSDGFPNDLDYKGDHAIADTRRAAQEARARQVHVKAITVNIGSDPRLDALYGRNHHYVIGDVRDLPDKLLRLYGLLTRRS
ncbi:VWA domain-containing protein [Desulfatitalea alkaliphila]|uniref:VWA domain-containing protein n=1 Tax=Desulfatitalea alkaliphila TaxID=2929485 RepID=UPI00248676E5|nr:VWA domain-containing protein [Desulfatitalea alkaliphila]